MLKFEFLGANGSCQDPESGNTSLLFSDGKGAFCVDLSCNMASVVDEDVDAVILTHEHIDHVYALPSLLHQLWLTGRSKPLAIYIPAGLERITNGLIDLFSIRSKKGIFPICVSTEDTFTVGDMCVRTFRTDHTDMSVGVVVESGSHKVVYSCDTRPIREVPDGLQGTDVLIHEASGLQTDEQTLIKKGHSSGADAASLAKQLGVMRLFLCHLPRGTEKKNGILAEAKAIFPQTDIPEILHEYTV